MNSEIFKHLREAKEFLERKGYSVFGVSLKGSQNYNLHTVDSDYDFVAIIIPTIKQILNGGVSKKYTLEHGGEITVHDIIKFENIINKGNPQYVEVANTPYQIGNMKLFKHYKINPKALCGMALEKEKALTKEYPSTKAKIAKFGYDPKQLYTIFRLSHMVSFPEFWTKQFTYYETGSIEQQYMIAIKGGEYSLEEAVQKAKEKIKLIKEICNEMSVPINDRVDVYKILEVELYQNIIKKQASTKIDEILIQNRTFGNNLPKEHSKNFPILLEELNKKEDKDISYAIYMSLSIL